MEKILIIGEIMVKKLEVFISNNCHHCEDCIKTIKKAKEQIDFDYEIIDIMTKDGKNRALDYGLLYVPSIAINKSVEIIGTPSLKEFIKMVSI